MINKLPQIAKVSLLILIYGIPKLIVDTIMNFITSIQDEVLRQKLMRWSGCLIKLYE